MALDKAPPKSGPLRDTSVMWRASLWGGAAIVALATAVLMTQTDIGAQRLQMVFGSDPSPARIATQADFVPRPDPDIQRRETARLEAQVRELAADRERLNARIATLEQNLTDVTGSIKRELAANNARPQAPARLEPIAPAEPKDRPRQDAKQESRPQSAEVASSQGDRASEEDAKTKEAKAAAAKMADAIPQVSASQSASTPPSGPQVAPPLGDPIPLPPLRIASAVASEPPGKEIGIDLGGARSIEIMQARWAAVKANFGPLLDGLRPLVARDPRPNMIPYRLIVGPLPNPAAAAQVCARFAASKVTCRMTKFAGEQLSLTQ